MLQAEKVKKLILFIGSTLGLYLLWTYIYDSWLYTTQIDNWLIHQLGQSSVLLLNLLGYSSNFDIKNTLYIGKQAVVYIDIPCNGLSLLVVYCCFILCSPGKMQHKFFFIPLGIFLIHTINVIRIVALSLNLLINKHSFEFNHKYAFQIVVYSCIFFLWMTWIDKYSGLVPKKLVTNK